jgi:hypothetical protein
VGGDDKCGIFIALAMLDLFPAIKLAFFRDEEIGCKGSMEADVGFFSDVGMVLQADRRGYGDFVTEIGYTDLSSQEFLRAAGPYLRNHGYKETYGMMTDVEALVDVGIGVSCANISCGYHNPHTRQEYIDVGELEGAHDLIWDLIAALGDRRWDHTPVAEPVTKWASTKIDHIDWNREWLNKLSAEANAEPTGEWAWEEEEGAWGWVGREEDQRAKLHERGWTDDEIAWLDRLSSETDQDPDVPFCESCSTDAWMDWSDREGWYCFQCRETGPDKVVVTGQMIAIGG